jgi:beta-glucosidase
LGGIEKIDPKKAIRNAAKLAAESDVAIVVVGLNPDWESEGFDRKDLKLPGEQDELVEEVAKAADGRCVVVVQAVCDVSPPLQPE